MAKRYELSGEAWGVVSDLSIETHDRGRPRLTLLYREWPNHYAHRNDQPPCLIDASHPPGLR